MLYGYPFYSANEALKSMFGLLKTKNPYEQAAREVYADLLKRVREPVFYTDYAVPDTQEARFDLLLLHLFVIMQGLLAQRAKGAEDFNQALFDTVFANMDQSLREVGIGDMGVPKRMRRLMKAFNGRMHAYREALEGRDDMADALRRNLYAAAEAPDAAVTAMKNYVQRSLDLIQKQAPADIMNGNIVFAPVT
jgi:cytochrome b pre-mRNA-processing protein 3